MSINYKPLQYVQHVCPICNNRVRFPADECERAQYDAKYFREAFNKIVESSDAETRALRAEVEQLRAFRDSVPWDKIEEFIDDALDYGYSARGLRTWLNANRPSPTPPPNQA
jgi:hypothetical protein